MIKRIHSNFLYAHDLAATAKFYAALGFEPQTVPDAVRVKLGDFTLAFMDEGKAVINAKWGSAPKGLGIYIYVEVDDVDEHFAFVKQNGVEPSTEPKTWEWGKREFVVKDPDGYRLVFYSPIK